ncbi:MAG: type II toxin-antitoxin system PemK/MazF family toxin [bacterium]|nr:type II toxin-antitoxin system PemK/MazF family toxin [bacterium]MDE0351417.1 type II toxin-antitoxin system PemK/MazF family toxin [bacterium]
MEGIRDRPLPSTVVPERVIGAPCSTVTRNLATEVVLEPDDDPVPLPSVVQLDSTFNVSVSRLGRLSGERMRQVCTALATAVGGC